MVVGFVSGTGAGLVETFVRSTAGGCGVIIVCLVSNDSDVWAPRFGVSCALMVAVGLVFADELCNMSRSDLAEASGESAEEVTFSTESDAGLVLKESKLNPPTHPRKRASANDNTPVIIVMADRVTSRTGATRSRLSILISRSHANAASGVVDIAWAIGGASEPLFKFAVPLLVAEGTVLSRPLEEANEPAVKFCERSGSIGHLEAASA